MEVIDFK